MENLYFENTLKVFRTIDNTGFISKTPKPYLYMSIFGAWIFSIFWFGPRLFGLISMAYSIPSLITLILFDVFILIAWLYGFYNVGVIVFAFVHKYFSKKPEKELIGLELLEIPEVAILYTTCNDFVEASLQSCVNQDYSNFKVYVLDDSSDPAIQKTIDTFCSQYPKKIEVVRRPTREGFKAGNMNNALRHVVREPYFAIADADEILPTDFLSKLVPVMESDSHCGFVQANHRVNKQSESALSGSLGVGIDIHWKYYQPVRNEYGFVMFLGHGALLRKKCWEEIGGFPDIVSEDLGFAIHARELGYRGRFVEDVVCLEDFPDTIRSFRIRHIKWTRGTCEFLYKKFWWLVKSKNISIAEKLDILFPTMNLPLTLVYFLFMIVANLMLPFYFGKSQDLTIALSGYEVTLPIFALHDGFEAIYTIDFFTITLMTFFAPVLCFVVAMYQKPMKLFRFISHSTAVYAALGVLSSIGVLSFLISRKAIFLVTGDVNQNGHASVPKTTGILMVIKQHWRQFIDKSHPDSYLVQGTEIFFGLLFAIVCIAMFQISFFGLCLAFILLPMLHHFGWKHKYLRALVHLPFLFIMLGIFLSGLNLFGIQAVFFGYGFHF